MTTPISIDPETPVMKVVADLFREEAGTVYQRTTLYEGLNEYQTMTRNEGSINLRSILGEGPDAELDDFDWTIEDYLSKMDQFRLLAVIEGIEFDVALDQMGFNESDREWLGDMVASFSEDGAE